MTTLYDPSKLSAHVDDRFYQRLVDDAAAFQAGGESAPPAARAECEVFLVQEARLLDDRRLEDWQALFAGDGVYWIPHTFGGGDPRRQICLAFDDRRRLEDRIVWLRTGKAYSQVPPSRTTRLISNVEAWSTPEPDELLVRSNFVVYEVRTNEQRAIPGWCGHRLRRRDGGWEIVVKLVNLLEADRALENMTVLL